MQICIDLASHILADKNGKTPETMADAFIQLNKMKLITDETATRLVKAVGFRNLAVHEYDKINYPRSFCF